MAFSYLAEEEMLREGYPAYTTSCAWLGYSDQQLKQVSAYQNLLIRVFVCLNYLHFFFSSFARMPLKAVGPNLR